MNNLVKATYGLFAVAEPAAANLPAIVPTLPALAGEVRAAHAEAQAHLAKGAQAAIRAGEALLAAKKLLKEQYGHGEWEDYVRIECGLKARTAQVYMQLAKEKEKLQPLLAPNPQDPAVLSQSAALKFLSVAKGKPRRKPKPKEE
jgi:hypothetical protein